MLVYLQGSKYVPMLLYIKAPIVQWLSLRTLNPETSVRIRVGAIYPTQSNGQDMALSRPGSGFNSPCGNIVPHWRNWITRETSNLEIAGSSPAWGEQQLQLSWLEHRSYEPKVCGSSPHCCMWVVAKFASYTAKTDKKGGIRNTLKPVQKGLMYWLRLCCYHKSEQPVCVLCNFIWRQKIHMGVGF